MGTLKVNNIQSTIDGSVSFPQGLSSSTQPISIPNGTASLPSLRFDSDTDTGFYRIGANTIGIASNGTRIGEIGNGYGGFTGNIIQVVSGELTTRVTTTSISYVDTGLSATITPRYSTSRILVLFNSGAAAGGNSSGCFFNIVRGSTNIAQSTGGTITNQTGWGFSNSTTPYPISASVLDSPNTTSLTTYKIQFRNTTGSDTVAIGGRASANDYPAYSSLILMELQQ